MRILLARELVLKAPHCNTQQHTVTHCNALQRTATHCNTLQHNRWNYLLRTCIFLARELALKDYLLRLSQLEAANALNYYFTALQLHTATHCSTLQCTATNCKTIQLLLY